MTDLHTNLNFPPLNPFKCASIYVSTMYSLWENLGNLSKNVLCFTAYADDSSDTKTDRNWQKGPWNIYGRKSVDRIATKSMS